MILQHDLCSPLRAQPGLGCGPVWATLLLVLVGVAWTRAARQARVAGGAHASAAAVAAGRDAGAGGRNHARFSPMRRQAREVCVGRAHAAGLDGGWSGLAGLVLDWCDDQIPLWAGYLNSRASANGAQASSLTSTLQAGSAFCEWIFRWIVVPAKMIPLRDGFSAVGMAAAVAKTAAHDVELAVVDRRCDCCARGRAAAQAISSTASRMERFRTRCGP